MAQLQRKWFTCQQLFYGFVKRIHCGNVRRRNFLKDVKLRRFCLCSFGLSHAKIQALSQVMLKSCLTLFPTFDATCHKFSQPLRNLVRCCKPASKQASKQATNQASKQASDRASDKPASEQARKQANKQASKRANRLLTAAGWGACCLHFSSCC